MPSFIHTGSPVLILVWPLIKQSSRLCVQEYYGCATVRPAHVHAHERVIKGGDPCMCAPCTHHFVLARLGLLSCSHGLKLGRNSVQRLVRVVGPKETCECGNWRGVGVEGVEASPDTCAAMCSQISPEENASRAGWWQYPRKQDAPPCPSGVPSLSPSSPYRPKNPFLFAVVTKRDHSAQQGRSTQRGRAHPAHLRSLRTS